METPLPGSDHGAAVSFEPDAAAGRDAIGKTSRFRWRQWFEPRTDWQARFALVPAELGQRILTIYLWTAGLGMVGAAVPVFVQNPGGLRHTATYWLFFGTAGIQLAAAVARGARFVLRYVILASTLFAMSVIGAATVGITPTWVMWTAILLSSTGLLFGVTAGLVGVIAITATTAAIAWGWTHGALPIVITHPGDSIEFYDYRATSVWFRVLATSSIFITGLLLLMRYVLSNLRQALRKSTATLARLATEREQREVVTEALRVSEAKYAKLFQVSPVSIIVSEMATGRIVEVNEAFLKTYDCTREQAVGRTTVELGLWRDVGQRAQIVDRLTNGSAVRDFHVKGRTASGAPITVLVNCERVDIAGEACILTMVQDITEQEAAELALRDSEEKFSRAFRSGPNAMAISEFETGRYIEINESFERLFGFPRDEALGHTSLELGIWRSTAERQAFMAQLATDGAVRDFELETVNRHSEPVIYIVNAEYLTLGGIRYVVMSAQDITARKRAEADRARAVEREMQARAEFTRRLIGAQEEERRRIAAELHDSLGQNLLLLKNRAHLALGSGAEPDALHRQFEGIEKMAGDAIAEVRQISHDLHPYQLDQLGLTRAIEGMIASAGRNSSFRFNHRLDMIDDLFTTDTATHLFRVVQECVNNILKHSRATVATLLLERDIHQVRLWVEDDGCGFVSGGHGFGLKSIAERTRILGGTLSIDSAPGRGTRLEVIVPMPAP